MLDIIHGGSRVTIEPRISTMSGRKEHVGLSLTRQALLAPGAKRYREVFGGANEG